MAQMQAQPCTPALLRLHVLPLKGLSCFPAFVWVTIPLSHYEVNDHYQMVAVPSLQQGPSVYVLAILFCGYSSMVKGSLLNTLKTMT